jgi:hypothetical protein
MTRRLMRRMTIGTALCAALLAAKPTWAQGRTAYVMNWPATELMTLDTANPGIPISSAPITGITPGETLVDLDIRPLNGMLYALGVNGTTDTMTLYVLSPRTGVATPVGAGVLRARATCPISIPPSRRTMPSTSIRPPFASAA